jgi:hypothetical protein
MTRRITVNVSEDASAVKLRRAVYDYSYILSYTLTTIGEDGTEINETYTETLERLYSYEFFRDTS